MVQAESDAAKAKLKCDDMEQKTRNTVNRSLISQTAREGLQLRLDSMEERLQAFEARLPSATSLDCTPKRSISQP